VYTNAMRLSSWTSPRRDGSEQVQPMGIDKIIAMSGINIHSAILKLTQTWTKTRKRTRTSRRTTKDVDMDKDTDKDMDTDRELGIGILLLDFHTVL
jgi:hypothetical protein